MTRELLMEICARSVALGDPDDARYVLEEIAEELGLVVVLAVACAELFRRELTHTHDAIALRTELNFFNDNRKLSFDA
jgi:hypothetical protein